MVANSVEVQCEDLIDSGEDIGEIEGDKKSEAKEIETGYLNPGLIQKEIHIFNEDTASTFTENRLNLDPIVAEIELHLVILNIAEFESEFLDTDPKAV